MDYVGKAVKFQHRVATGHSILGPSFTVESKNPLAAPDDPPSSQTVKKDFRHFKPVPTQLVVDDALVLAAPPSQDGSAPRVILLHANGNPLMGADWHNAVSMEVDVPHREHEGAEESERFYFDPNEDLASYVDGSEKRSAAQSERIRELTLANELLKAQLAQTTQPGPTLVSSASGSSSQPPAPQPEPDSNQNANDANGQQDAQPVAGVADQVQGEKPDAPDAAPQVAGNAAEVNEAPSPEQPAQ